MAYVDIETIAINWLTALVFTDTGTDRVRVAAEVPSNWQPASRLVTVAKSPSSPGDGVITLDVVDLDVDCYARTRTRARALAEQVRAAFRLQLPLHTDPATGAFIRAVATITPPVPAPWEAEAIVRFTATYRLWVHHNPA